MTEVDFYFNAEDPLQVTCRLAAKAMAQKKRLLIYAADAETLSRIDRMLWTSPAIGFLPHCHAGDPLASDTPVLLAADEQTPEHCEILLNLSPECPPHFERFERLLELVGTDEAGREAGRSRYRFYKQRGYAVRNHDLMKTDSASSG
jgi:DNA polymerase-3 subunit chi